VVSSAHRARKEREHCNALLCAPVHLHVLFGCVAHSLGVYTVKLSQEYSINFLPFMAVAHPATARQQLRPVSATCMQWILLQETRPEHRRCGWCAASFQSPFPSPEPGSNLVKDLPRAQTGQANLLLSPLFSLHSLAPPESYLRLHYLYSISSALHICGVAHEPPARWPAFLPETNHSTLLAPAVQAPTQRLARYKRQPDRCDLRPSKPPRDRLGCEYTMQGGPPPSYHARSPPSLPSDVVRDLCAGISLGTSTFSGTSWQGDLGQLAPGIGYEVKVSQAMTFNYGDSSDHSD